MIKMYTINDNQKEFTLYYENNDYFIKYFNYETLKDIKTIVTLEELKDFNNKKAIEKLRLIKNGVYWNETY